MTQSAIQVNDLHKAFGDNNAVQGVSFEVQQGEIFSLLGPNGAGKTTTISMLATLLRPDQGDAFVMGHSIRKEATAVRAVLGVVPQEIALYEDLSARENLLFWGKMYGLRGGVLKTRVDEALEIIGLTERASGQLSKFSGGMKRRVNIAAALLHRPAVIFMDEPTVGIDPQSRRNILDSVVALKEQGMTVLYTTHYMEEAQELSDHIAIMDHGKLISLGTHAELVKIVGEADRIRLAIHNPRESLDQIWGMVPGVKQVSSKDGVFTILALNGHQVLPRLFEAAGDQAAQITSVEIQQPDLEAVFLHLTGRALRD
ncbi:MAG: export ABC transporter ATP-binding protein [Chloroflexi bacterium RBG_16_57_11]|nr:MAG: export ABC transporter ATP-binding protein [Chloroflexi bacterium RBG_16_57_11]